MASDECNECPLCMDPLDFDDLEFYPCSCGYQICRFCWTKIINEENGLCPACRKPYNSEKPASFNPMTEEEILKMKKEKRKKDQTKKSNISECRKHLADFRVVQKNLVFVVGIPSRLANDRELLKSPDYLGKYGNIFKIVFNQSVSSNSQSAYITYCRSEDAMRAILDLRNQQIDGRTVKVSLGTTKYCSQFLRGANCTKTDCMYLHELADKTSSFTKQEMQQGRHTEYEQQLMAQFCASIPSLLSTNKTATRATTEVISRRKREVSTSSTNSNPSGRGDLEPTNHTFTIPLSDSGRSTAASSQGSLASSSSSTNHRIAHSPPLINESVPRLPLTNKGVAPASQLSNEGTARVPLSNQTIPQPTRLSEENETPPNQITQQSMDDVIRSPPALDHRVAPSYYENTSNLPKHRIIPSLLHSDENLAILPLMDQQIASVCSENSTHISLLPTNDDVSGLSNHRVEEQSSTDIVSGLTNQRIAPSPSMSRHNIDSFPINLPFDTISSNQRPVHSFNPLMLPQLTALQLFSAAVASSNEAEAPPPGFEGCIPPRLDHNLFGAPQFVATALQQQQHQDFLQSNPPHTSQFETSPIQPTTESRSCQASSQDNYLGEFHQTLKTMLPHANISFGTSSFNQYDSNRPDQVKPHQCTIDDPAILMSGQIASSPDLKEDFWSSGHRNMPILPTQFPNSIWDPVFSTTDGSLDDYFCGNNMTANNSSGATTRSNNHY